MKRYLPIVFILATSGCACALDDEDRAEGKPGMGQCIATSMLKGAACSTNTTDPNACPGRP